MAKRIGVLCIALGFLCLFSAVGLIVYNHMEEKGAEAASAAMLRDVQQMTEAEEEPLADAEYPAEMPTVDVDGNPCIGVLSIPVLELELPVLTDWSYAKLKVAPCHYYGTCYEPNFVIAAHNYQSHFGRLSELQPKDLIVFTDVAGNVFCYEVVLLETLMPEATKEMINGGFDLSLYTCTPGGGSRVTVRCNLK